jgi:RimJ/RimL family protein N-acetyltransferase
MTISIKQAREVDWQDFRAVRLMALQSDPGVFSSTYQREAGTPEADWRSRLRSDDVAVFLIYENAALVGMTGIAVDWNDPSRKRALLWGSWLEPRVRRQGLSQILYRSRIDWAEKHPTIERIVVSHRASNLASKRANQRHGFRFTHSEDKVWPDGVKEDDIFYVLDVKGSGR